MEGVIGDFETIFEREQPSFKRNFLSMSGYADEAAFGRELKARLPLGDLLGEFDEPGRDERYFAQRDGRTTEGSGDPPGGSAGVPSALAERRGFGTGAFPANRP